MPLKQRNSLLAPGLSLQPTLAIYELAPAAGRCSQPGKPSIFPWPSSSHSIFPVALLSAISVCCSSRPDASLRRMASFPAPSSLSRVPWRLNYKPALLAWLLLSGFFKEVLHRIFRNSGKTAIKQLYSARAANLIFNLLPVRSSGPGSRWHLADLLRVSRPDVSIQ